MMGMVRGCAAIVQESYPLMNPVHCFNYRMNLAQKWLLQLERCKMRCMIGETYTTLSTLQMCDDFDFQS